MFRAAALLLAAVLPLSALAAEKPCFAIAGEIDSALRAFAEPSEVTRPADRISIRNAVAQHKAAGLDYGVRLSEAELGTFSLEPKDREQFHLALDLFARAGGEKGLVMLDAIQGTAYCHNPMLFAAGGKQRLQVPEPEPFSLCMDGGVALGAAAGTVFYAETRDNRLDADEMKIFSLRDGGLTEACTIVAQYQIKFEVAESFCGDRALCADYSQKVAFWAERLRLFNAIEAPGLTPAATHPSPGADFPLFGAKESALVPQPFSFDGTESWFALSGDPRADLLRIGPASDGPRMMADWSSFTLATLYRQDERRQDESHKAEPVASFVVEKRRGIYHGLATFEKLSPSTGPEAFVAALYRAVAGTGGYETYPIAIFAEPLGRAHYFSQGLRAALAEMDKNTSPGDEPDLDFDPITSSQDPDVKGLKIAIEQQTADKAIVRADFQRGGAKPERIALHYVLVREAEGWRVDDIERIGKDGWRVRVIVSRSK